MEQNQNQNLNNSNEIEIDLGELLRALWNKKIIIVLAGMVAALAAILLSKFILPEVYQSQTKVYISNQESSDTVTYSDLQSGTQLTNDYKEIVTSRPVLDKVKEEIELEEKTDEIAAMISVEVKTDTRMLEIKVNNGDPFLARDIADAVREAASEQIAEVMSVVNVSKVESANIPDKPSSPNVKRNAALGAILGLALAIFGVLLVYLLDDTIKTTEDVERYLGVGVLGSIPVIDETPSKKKKASRSKIKKGGK